MFDQEPFGTEAPQSHHQPVKDSIDRPNASEAEHQAHNETGKYKRNVWHLPHHDKNLNYL